MANKVRFRCNNCGCRFVAEVLDGGGIYPLPRSVVQSVNIQTFVGGGTRSSIVFAAVDASAPQYAGPGTVCSQLTFHPMYQSATS